MHCAPCVVLHEPEAPEDLDERISEYHKLKTEGVAIGALAMIVIDDPTACATGHRICDDRMKSCIYQRQDPVDIPQAETRTRYEERPARSTIAPWTSTAMRFASSRGGPSAGSDAPNLAPRHHAVRHVFGNRAWKENGPLARPVLHYLAAISGSWQAGTSSGCPCRRRNPTP